MEFNEKEKTTKQTKNNNNILLAESRILVIKPCYQSCFTCLVRRDSASLQTFVAQSSPEGLLTAAAGGDGHQLVSQQPRHRLSTAEKPLCRAQPVTHTLNISFVSNLINTSTVIIIVTTLS